MAITNTIAAPSAWIGGGIAGVLLAGAALAQGTGDPAQNWATIARCAGLDSARARQACVDQVFRATGLLDRAKEVAQQRDTFGQQPSRARPTPAPPPAASPAPARQVAAPAPAPVAPPAELTRIATTVSRAFDPGNRLMVIATQDGQIWQQLESKDIGLPPRAGTAFTVERGALGSFVCRIAGGRSFRCRRHD